LSLDKSWYNFGSYGHGYCQVNSSMKMALQLQMHGLLSACMVWESRIGNHV